MDAFFAGELDRKPLNAFTDGEPFWFEFTMLLEDEGACGATVDDNKGPGIAMGHSDCVQVRETTRGLEALNKEALHDRFDALFSTSPPDQVVDFGLLWRAVECLTAFYKAACENRSSVVFLVR